MKTYSTFEYTEVKYEVGKDERVNLEESKLYLTKDSIEYLEKLNIAQVFRSRIRFQNYVGVISFRDLKLEILPKFMKTSERLVEPEHVKGRETILSNLVRMLEFSGWGGIRSADLTHLGTERDFFEIYTYLFARNLANLLKTNRDAAYTSNYDELRFVRGRIDFRKYGNPARLHRIPCHYYERSTDTTINRTLKYVSFLLLKKVESAETRRLLKLIISILDSAQLTPVSVSEIERIVFNRLNSSFEPYVNFCKIFLQNSILSLQSSDVEFFSFLIPMEVLFEKFIARAIEDTVGDLYEVRTQPYAGYLARRDGRGIFALQPDIILEGEETKIIVDTKYKLLNPEDRKLGVSQQDLYQMYAYCKELNSKRCVLLYPEGVNGEIKQDFKLGKDEIDLHVRTVSLEYPFEDNKLSEDFRSALIEAIGIKPW
jgi:5-methylcytosine-specific restriction enzyme subunit McrC